jgi:hypothetical protein
MNIALIGYGEIGKAIHEVYKQYHNFDIYDLAMDVSPELKHYDVMLIAIPYTDNFIEIVKGYQESLKPNATIIFSSVAVGTTASLENAVHVPIEGKHPNLSESIKQWQVFMGGYNPWAYSFFIYAGINPVIFETPDITEFLKLQSTTNYGLMIEYARYVDSVCEKLGVNYGFVNMYNQAYNALYQKLDMPQFSRYILTPPEGKKGGHCITSNALILREQFPSVLVDVVSEVSNGSD